MVPESQLFRNLLFLFFLFLLTFKRQSPYCFLQLLNSPINLLLLPQINAKLIKHNGQYLCSLDGSQLDHQPISKLLGTLLSLLLQNQLEDVGQTQHRFSIKMINFQYLPFHKLYYQNMHSCIFIGYQLQQTQHLRYQLLRFIFERIFL